LPAAVSVLQSLADRAAVGQTHLPVTFIAITLVHCYLESGDLNQAAHAGEAALAAAETHHLDATEDYFRLAATVMDAYMGLGDFLRARMWADRYLAHAVERGQPVGQAALYWNAAILAEKEGRLGEALAMCERALGLFGELGTVRDTPRLQVEMAWLLLLDDPPQVQRAAELLRHAEHALADLGSGVDRARWSWVRAVALLHEGNVQAAEVKALQAAELVGTSAPLERVQVLVALGDVLSAQGRGAEATEMLLSAQAALADAPLGRATSTIWRDVAQRLALMGRFAEAIEAFERALDGAGIRDRSVVVRRRIQEMAAQRLASGDHVGEASVAS
jgi:tetratricopeptide (TPR) repeat protein